MIVVAAVIVAAGLIGAALLLTGELRRLPAQAGRVEAALGELSSLLEAQHAQLPLRTRSRVVVTLKSGQAFRGVLVDVDADALVLRDAEQLARGGERTVVDGELIVLRPDVEFLQRP